MDDNVLAAMARWPDVPDVYGWLSLSESGHWRLHPTGDACADGNDSNSLDSNDGPRTGSHAPSRGEGITSPQILRFIDHNYGHDDQKRWFFQNGPQKVYVRVDAAPYILHTQTASSANPCGLVTHNGLAVGAIREWCLDDSGKLYAQTDHGPGLVAGRDLAFILERLHTLDGQALLEILERYPDRKDPLDTQPLRGADTGPATPHNKNKRSSAKTPFQFAAATDIPRLLGFVRCPTPSK
ncbi:DUF2946 family protein [Candidimonas sp. SYP-B2681]|uniref:DUF2946 family protein n=1 Tax=Candidimonas sp. SYP-B2681 TaxID=2497686 RepID=UPI000F85C0E8|nr:DUF2946 family protein [Candidimonas sp. SYP-B2681]RTZ42324.1 DUF2946 family protein [Candidimonas sp. SYP-B2681]